MESIQGEQWAVFQADVAETSHIDDIEDGIGHVALHWWIASFGLLAANAQLCQMSSTSMQNHVISDVRRHGRVTELKTMANLSFKKSTYNHKR